MPDGDVNYIDPNNRPDYHRAVVDAAAHHAESHVDDHGAVYYDQQPSDDDHVVIEFDDADDGVTNLVVTVNGAPVPDDEHRLIIERALNSDDQPAGFKSAIDLITLRTVYHDAQRNYERAQRAMLAAIAAADGG